MSGQMDVILLFPGAFARQWEKGNFFPDQDGKVQPACRGSQITSCN